MGEKKRAEINQKYIKVGSIILKTVGAIGLMSAAMLAPNVLQVLKQFGYSKKSTKHYYLKSAIGRLKDRGFIEFKKNKNGVMCVILTEKGRVELARYEFQSLKLPKPHKWDRKYRVVIFDIKEWRRGIRDQLRRWLLKLGFVRLQNSVWVYPYECQEIIVMIKSHFKIGKDVLYMTVDSIENDKWLKKGFGLT